MNLTLNNNAYYSGTSTGQGIGQAGTTAGANFYTTLAALKAYSSTLSTAGTNDNASFGFITAAPFVSNTDLHIAGTYPATQLESGGAIVSATTDYDGQNRYPNSGYPDNPSSPATAPDIGGDEFAGTFVTNMSYVSSTTTQVTGNAYPGISNQSIIRIEVVTSGSLNPLQLTQLVVNANGTTNIGDINGSPAKIYYTGASVTFGTSVLFGSATPTIANVNVNGSQTLVAGSNYFWLAYNVSPSAAEGDFIDGECISMIVNSITQIPTVTAPAGNKVIIGPIPAGTYTVGAGTFNKITGKNIYFEKVTKKVMQEVFIPGNPSGRTPDNNISTGLNQNGRKELREVEEISWIPMENGRKYEGKFYADISQYPELGLFGVNGIYATITAAIEDLNIRGVSGAIVFSLVDTAYTTGETYPITIDVTTSPPTASNTVTIKPKPGNSALISSSTATAIFKLYGADYIIIDGSNNGTNSQDLTITNSNPGTAAAIWIGSKSASNGATFDVVKNCNISGSGPTGTYAGISICSGSTLLSAAEVSNTDIIIQNNNITAFQNAVYHSGYASSPYDQNINITGNTFGSVTASSKLGFRGMILQNVQNLIVSGNNIIGVVTSATSTFTVSGIQIGGFINGGTIDKNKISDIKQPSSSGWGSNGIYIGSTSSASNLTISNNFIWDVASYGYPGVNENDNGYGIFINSGGGYNLYYNSIYLTTDQTAATGRTAALNVASGVYLTASVDLRNNIFVNSQTVGAQRFAIYCGAANTVFSNINYNDYYSASGPNLGYIASANRLDLAAWQTGSGQDFNSMSADPKFISTVDLHIDPLFDVVENKGTYIASVLQDIDGDVRSVSTPDIGADEYNYTPPVLPVFSVTPTSKGFGNCPLGNSTANQTFTISNTGGGTLTILTGGIILAGTDPGQFTLTDGNTYPINLTGAATATVQVEFSPTTLGVKNATLEFTDNSAGSPHSVALTGTGVPIYTLPYSQDFDGAVSDWSSAATVGADEWAIGSPSGKSQILTVHSGTSAYFTNLTGATSTNRDEYVLTPVFNFTSVLHPTLSFWHNFYTETNFDACEVQYTTDLGVTWFKLDANLGTGGNFNTILSTNWYNNNAPNGLMLPPKFSGSSTAYFGHSSGWIHSVSDLTAFSGKSAVQFKFRYYADKTLSFDGWAFDDFSVYNTAVENPSGLIAAASSSSQINLSWTNNLAGNNVMLVYNTSNTFGAPVNGTSYGIGNVLAGGGTVIDITNSGSFSHTGRNPGITYYYKAFSVDGSNNYSLGITANATTLCGVYPFPYAQSFDDAAFPTGCWLIINAGVGNNWTRSTSSPLAGPASLFYGYSISAPANTWAFTPGFNLTSGKRYIVSFWEKVQEASQPEKLKVTVGDAQTVVSQTTTLWDNAGGTDLTNTTYVQNFAAFDCTSTGTYYFAFNCYSDADMWNLYVDEVTIIEQPGIDLAFTQFYQLTGTLNPAGKEKFKDYKVSMHNPKKGQKQFEQLTNSRAGVKSSADNINLHSEKNSFVKNILNTPVLKSNKNINNDSPLLTNIDVATRVTNNGTNAASYSLDWSVGGTSQTQFPGPSVPSGTFNDATLAYTPSATGTFLTTGLITVTSDEVPSNDTAVPFRLRVYPDVFTRNINDRGDNIVDTYLGWNDISKPMKAGVRYTTSTSPVKPAGVDFICRTETVTSGTFTVQVRAAGTTTLAPGAVLYTKTYTTSDYFAADGDYIFFPFDASAPEIAASTDYWITIEAPLGILYPGGAHNSGFVTGRSFYDDGTSTDTWTDLIFSTTEYAWIMRPVETDAPPALTLGLTALLSGNYNGTTMVPKNVLVELHNSTTPYAIVDSQTVLLNTAGVSNPVFTKSENGTPYYIVLKSDNGLETWSATPQTFSRFALSYNFSTAATQAYGSNMILVGT